MNILTFDIEEWYLEKIYFGARRERYVEYDNILDKLLNVLDEVNTKATFFCLGEMVHDFAYVLKNIESRGHEIACHSNKHIWLNKLSQEEVMNDTAIAIANLEQCIGKKVISYRAPAFSIGASNKWAFEALSNCGIERDASVFPSSRDFGGYSSFEAKEPALVTYNGITIKEFPVSTVNVFGSEVAYSGGGYFRFFPLSFIKRQMEQQAYSMTYFHIGDIIPMVSRVLTREEYENYFNESGSLLNRYKRCIKGNIGTKSACSKLIDLLKSTEFMSLEEADENICWSSALKIELT
jgi:peptidoglycan/xylan/chitin deacetylase (PgdA/CDA1 family)